MWIPTQMSVGVPTGVQTDGRSACDLWDRSVRLDDVRNSTGAAATRGRVTPQVRTVRSLGAGDLMRARRTRAGDPKSARPIATAASNPMAMR
jgi:hypothetical protein